MWAEIEKITSSKRFLCDLSNFEAIWARFERFRAIFKPGMGPHIDMLFNVESNLTVLTSPGPASPLSIAIHIDIDRLSKYWSNIFNVSRDFLTRKQDGPFRPPTRGPER